MAQKRFLDKFIAKRDAAKAELDKWQGVIDLIHNDPDFASLLHHGKVDRMDRAKQAYQMVMTAKAVSGNGHRTTTKRQPKKTPRQKRQASEATRNVWANKTPAQRKMWVQAIQAAKEKKAAERAKAAAGFPWRGSRPEAPPQASFSCEGARLPGDRIRSTCRRILVCRPHQQPFDRCEHGDVLGARVLFLCHRARRLLPPVNQQYCITAREQF